MTVHHYREEHGLDTNPLVEITDSVRESSVSEVVDASKSREESEPAEVKHG